MPDKEEFSFIKEKIKDKPINKKWVFYRFLITIGLAIVFGLVACVVFVTMKPVIEEWMPKDENSVVIPPDEYEIDDTEKTTENTETTQDTEPVYITEKQELEPEDYQSLQKKLFAI